ncbi:MAG: lipid biosynthesis B12-binding/radical SAM protein [Rikenellaceae bacterium]
MEYRVALISLNRLRDPYPVYPLATAYLKPYLEEHLPVCKVDVIDLNMFSDDELEEHIRTTKPHFICLSIRNVDGANSLDRRAFFGAYKTIVDKVKGCSDSPIIIGGAGYSIFPEQFVEELGADYGIEGEGEAALCELLKALINKTSTADIQRVTHRGGARNKTCHHILSSQVEYEPKLVEYYWKQSGMLNIQTKRGCPYNCIYCTYPQIDGRAVRTMSVEKIVETIEKAKRDFGANYWFFTDSVFNIKNEYNAELCEELVKRDMGIKWGAYFSPSNITEEQMSLYQRSGLTHIEFGTESFCDKTLEAYGKRFTFEDVLSASALALKHNVYYSHFLILAGYGESREQLHTTIENSRQLRHTVIFPYVGMRIYPGTELYKRALEEDVVDESTDMLMPQYYLQRDFDLDETKQLAEATGKAWIFPDSPPSEMMTMLKVKRNKKGPLWEYLRKP